MFSITLNKAIGKCSPEWIFLNLRFLLSFGRVKTELSKTLTSQRGYQSMRLEHRGSREGILIIFFSFVEYRISLSNIEFRISQYVRVNGGIYVETLIVWTQIFFARIKEMHFQKMFSYVLMWP